MVDEKGGAIILTAVGAPLGQGNGDPRTVGHSHPHQKNTGQPVIVLKVRPWERQPGMQVRQLVTATAHRSSTRALTRSRPITPLLPRSCCALRSFQTVITSLLFYLLDLWRGTLKAPARDRDPAPRPPPPTPGPASQQPLCCLQPPPNRPSSTTPRPELQGSIIMPDARCPYIVHPRLGRPPMFPLYAFVASFCLAGLQQLRVADAHGFLLSPQSRNIQSYYGPESPGKEYTPQGLVAGGPDKVKLGGGGLAWPHGKYGACGDPYDAQTQKWLVPREKTTYIKGSTIQVQAVITAYHKGRFGFSICPYTSNGIALEACFQRPESIMTRADGIHPGEPYFYLESIGDGAATKTPYPGTDAFVGKDTYAMTYRLPAGLECSHCVMRWHYLTGNSCQPPCNPADPHWDASNPEFGCDVNNMGVCGTSVDMAYPEEFWNCADIEITSGGALSNPPPPSPANPGPKCNQGSDAERAVCFCQGHPFGQFADIDWGCNGFFDCYEGGTVYTACQTGLLYDEAISDGVLSSPSSSSCCIFFPSSRSSCCVSLPSPSLPSDDVGGVLSPPPPPLAVVSSPPSSPPPVVPNPNGLPFEVEAALQNTNYAAILRSQQPDLTWAPSSIYFWPDLVSALTSMHVQGVGGSKFWLGDTSANGYKYGLVSVAAFLAQSMKETVQYDACDKTNWDSTSGYSTSNACGQLGQSYQNYNCPAG
eukprot:gene10158-8062_t